MSTLPLSKQELIDGATDLETIEAIANSSELTVSSRTGGTVKTMAGVRAATKYDVPVAYTSGLNVTTETFTVDEGGVIYAVKPSSLPIASTPGTFDSSDWYPIQDPRGYSYVDTIAELGDVNVSGLSDGYAIEVNYGAAAGDNAGGIFRWDSSDLSTEVARDTRKGIWVPPDSDTSGASGAWVREYSVVNLSWFRLAMDGTTDEGAVVQAAHTAAGKYGVVIYPCSKSDAQKTINMGTQTLEIPLGQTVYHNKVILKYTGTGNAIEFQRYSATVVGSRYSIHDLLVTLTASGATGVDVLCSYSKFYDCAVSMQETNQIGWLMDCDFVNGSGSYYDHFYSCESLGTTGKSGQWGVKWATSATYPTRAANSNRWYTGRIAAVETGFHVAGAGNHIEIMSEAIDNGGTHVVVNNPETSSAGAGCTGNFIHIQYQEGVSGANGVVVGPDYANATKIFAQYQTSLGGGTPFTDGGTNTYYEGPDGIITPKITLGGSSQALDDYQEGTFTPTITGSTGGTPTYTTQWGRYTKVGDNVTFSLQITLSNASSFTGILTVDGLPFTPLNETGASYPCTIGIISGLSAALASNNMAYAYIPGTIGKIYIRKSDGSTVANVTPGNTFSISISGSYQTAA